MRSDIVKCPRALALYVLLTMGFAAYGAPEALVPFRQTRISDSLGFNWDINTYGIVGDGSNDCFDNAMMLYLDNNQVRFNDYKMTADGKTIFLKCRQGTWEVTRWIWLDTERGAVVYVDAFHNVSGNGKPQNLNAQVRTNLGGTPQQLMTSNGDPFSGILGSKDRGLFAVGAGSRPSCLMLFRSERAAVPTTLTVQNNRNVVFTYSSTVDEGDQIAFLSVIGQRNALPADKIADEFKRFYKGRLVGIEIPDELKEGVVNFRLRPVDPLAAVREALLEPLNQLIDELEVKDRGNRDVVIIDKKARLVGRIEGKGLTVQTRFGAADVAMSEVALLTGQLSGAASSSVYLRNGEILVGNVTLNEVKLIVGKELTLNLNIQTLNALVMHGEEDPQTEFVGDELLLLRLRDGSRLALKALEMGKLPLMLSSPVGPLTIPLNRIVLMRPAVDPLPHLVISLKGGSTIPVQAYGPALKVESLRFGGLDLQPTLVNGLLHLVRPPPEEDESDEEKDEAPPSETPELTPPYCEMFGDFKLVGNLKEAVLNIQVASGQRELTISELMAVERLDEDSVTSPEFEFHLRGGNGEGSLIAGTFVTSSLAFATADMEIEVPVILLTRLITASGSEGGLQ